ncbi:MAG TPA: F0F1 ATP synthase subunit delta [Candidatus Paceibacterota bacterium]
MKYPAVEYAKYLLSLNESSPAEQKIGTKKLSEMLEKNGDLKDWKKIVEIYESLKEKGAKKKRAIVSYFGDIHKMKIKESLADYEVEFEEDKNLVGGVRIQIGDIRIDNSIAGRLEEIKKVLAK